MYVYYFDFNHLYQNIMYYIQINVNHVNKKGETALFTACNKGNEEMVKILLTNKVCLHKNNLIYVQGYYI